jgi:nucleotide-binding universal stress UspA family protein
MKQPLRVLIPYDFSRHSEETLNFAIGLNHAYACSYLLLHVIPGANQDGMAMLWDEPSGQIEHRQVEAKKALFGIAERLQSLDENLQTDVLISSGIPFREICRVADENNIQLIVIGTHGRTGLSHLLMGSTAERVVQHAACPVLSVKPKFH